MGARIPLRSPAVRAMCDSMSQRSSGPSFSLVCNDLDFTMGDNAGGNGETSLEFENGANFNLAFQAPGLNRLISLISGLTNFPLQHKTEAHWT